MPTVITCEAYDDRPIERADLPLCSLDSRLAMGQSACMGNRSDGGEKRSLWRIVFLAVEAPNFTGFESRHSRRGPTVLIAATLLTALGLVVALGSSDTTTPSTPTYPPLTFVTVPTP
jgi:hypothetical protein